MPDLILYIPYKIMFIWDLVTINFFVLDAAVSSINLATISHVLSFIHHGMWQLPAWNQRLFAEMSRSGFWLDTDNLLPSLQYVPTIDKGARHLAYVSTSNNAPWLNPDGSRSSTRHGLFGRNARCPGSVSGPFRAGGCCSSTGHHLGQRWWENGLCQASHRHPKFNMSVFGTELGGRSVPYSPSVGARRPWPAPHPGESKTLQHMAAEWGARFRSGREKIPVRRGTGLHHCR